MKHIVLFGDSMFGRFGRDYVLKLENALGGMLVHNCATGGFDTRDGLKHAAFIARLRPAYICLSFGANDCNPAKGQPVPLIEFQKNLDLIIETFAGSKIILFPCPPVYDPNDPVGTQEFNELLKVYNGVVYKMAVQKQVDCIDSMSIYGDLLIENRAYHTEDGLHLNGLGYNKLIEELLVRLKDR